MAISQLADDSATPPPTEKGFQKVVNDYKTNISFSIRHWTRTGAAGLSRAKDERWTLKPKVLENELNSIIQIYLR